MKKNDARKLWKTLQEELGKKMLDKPLAKLGWNFGFDRAKKRLGHTNPKTKMITLSEILIQNGLPEETLKDTLRHEISHAIDFEQRNYSAHDSRWKTVARACGANPERTGEIPEEVKPEHRWHRYCPDCEKVVGRYYKKPTSKRYVCKSCRGNLDVVKAPGHPDMHSSS